jgi:ankyrin repeat protein
MLVTHGADVNAQDALNTIPIYSAIVWGHKEIIEILISHAAAHYSFDDMLLEIVSAYGYDEINGYELHETGVEWLLTHGANVNARDDAGNTPIHRVVAKDNDECYTCDKELIQVLIAHGADVNAQDNNGETPLDIVDKAIDRTCDGISGFREYFEIYEEIKKILIMHGANADLGTKLFVALKQQNSAWIQQLLDQGVDVNTAVELGSSGWMSMGADPDLPLNIAIRTRNKKIIELLIAHGADANGAYYSKTPLRASICTNETEIVELLIAHGADVNAQDNSGVTPLHTAAYWGYKEIVGLLIAEGADVNAKDQISNRPLHGAVYEGHKEIVELLLIHGADVHVQDYWNKTPLHLATHAGHKEIAALLIAHGANR